MSSKTHVLVTVNTAPERAKRLIGRVVSDLSPKYTIVHVANCERISDVLPVLRSLIPSPTILFTASMWTPEESKLILDTARYSVAGIQTLALPQGLQVQKGPDAVVEFIKEVLPGVLDKAEVEKQKL
ncbi:MAG: hypothetical protein M1834_009166 [Cirrosporium novae-zelandiae]|nr:MAG: hypothetical protein M1834_009166 [Cirrosporium novae-zelandiae]